MQKHESSPIKVGIFVFSGVALAMIIIFILGGQKQFFKHQYSLMSSFHNITGLRVGAAVQLAGLNVGTVSGISFKDDLQDKNVTVTLSIDKKYQKRIRKDSTAMITTLGLLGDKYASITMGSPDQEVLEDGQTITSAEQKSLDAIAEKSSVIIEKATDVVDSLSAIMKEIQKGDGLLHALIYESKDKPLAADVAATLKELKTASHEAADTMVQAKSIFQKVNEGQGTVGALLTDPSLYYDLRRIVSKVERNKLLTHVIRSRIRDLELESPLNEKTNPSD